MRKEFKVVSNTFTADFPSIVFLSELSFPFSIPNNPPTEFQMKKKFILIYFHLIKIYVNPYNILSLFLFHWSFSLVFTRVDYTVLNIPNEHFSKTPQIIQEGEYFMKIKTIHV